MKSLDHDLNLHPRAPDQGTHLSLIQNNISGGRIKKDQIDTIKQFPKVTEISISGLTQETFDYFIEKYGDQFKAIVFWKCPLVSDLKKIRLLNRVEHIEYFWNQRAEKLWDFSKTVRLRFFSFDDFTRMHDISDIAESPSIEKLDFGDKVWTKYILNTLAPLQGLASLKHLSFSAKKILDGRIEPIAHLKNLEELSFPTKLFTTEQIAWLKAHLPPTIKSKELNDCWKIDRPIAMNGKNKDTFITGKRKPFLDSEQDKARITRHVDRFNSMYQWYSDNPKASPEDYEKQPDRKRKPTRRMK